MVSRALSVRCLALGLLALLLMAAAPAAGDVARPGSQADVVFADYSPLAREAEVLRRMLSPLGAHAVDVATASGQALPEQSIDLAREHFALHVPPEAPAAGYGLLVFVPPWQDAQLPRGWAAALDKAGVIYVSAARSGNAEDILGRRIPLALLALENTRRRYRVDPARTYVGGFSGGARVAERIALAYPDAFRGAFVNASSDPLGAAPNQYPPRELFERFQEASRLFLVTGADDSQALTAQIDTARSLTKACAFAVMTHTTPSVGHAVAEAPILAQALAFLDKAEPANAARLAACREALDREASQALDKADPLIAAGRKDVARRLLLQIDERYGGLAAPRIVALAQACGCKLFPE